MANAGDELLSSVSGEEKYLERIILYSLDRREQEGGNRSIESLLRISRRKECEVLSLSRQDPRIRLRDEMLEFGRPLTFENISVEQRRIRDGVLQGLLTSFPGAPGKNIRPK